MPGNKCNLNILEPNHLKEKPQVPLTVLQKILLGALKWYGPRDGLVFILLRRKARYFTVKYISTLTLILDLLQGFKTAHCVSDGSACYIFSW